MSKQKLSKSKEEINPGSKLRVLAVTTALDPDCGLFICYQMTVDKHKGLNTCLCLLRKNLNNFDELIASDLPIT